MIVWIVLQGPAAAEDDGPENTELILERRVDPRYPAGQIDSVRCTMRAWVDERGHTEEPEAQGCPERFAQAAVKAMERWRYRHFPPVDRESPQRVRTYAVISFARRGFLLAEPPARCEWVVGVKRDGAMFISQQGDMPCAMWLPEGGQPPTLPDTLSWCRITRISRTEQDLSQCPEPMAPLAEHVLEWSFFGKAGEHVVTLAPAP
jgi:hypothetical protein